MSFPNFITHSDFSNMSIKDMKNYRKELISSVMAEASYFSERCLEVVLRPRHDA